MTAQRGKQDNMRKTGRCKLTGKKMKLKTEILDPLSSDSEEDGYGEEQWEQGESLLKTRDMKEHCEDSRNHGRRLEERGEAESRKDDRSKENFR
jgi:hypothetical protein